MRPPQNSSQIYAYARKYRHAIPSYFQPRAQRAEASSIRAQLLIRYSTSLGGTAAVLLLHRRPPTQRPMTASVAVYFVTLSCRPESPPRGHRGTSATPHVDRTAYKTNDHSFTHRPTGSIQLPLRPRCYIRLAGQWAPGGHSSSL